MTDKVKAKEKLPSRLSKAAKRAFFKTFNFESTKSRMTSVLTLSALTFTPLGLSYEAPDSLRTAQGAAQVQHYTQEIQQWGRDYANLEQRAGTLSNSKLDGHIVALRKRSQDIAFRFATDRDISEEDVYNLSGMFRTQHTIGANQVRFNSIGYKQITSRTAFNATRAASYLRENRPATGTVTAAHFNAAVSAEGMYFLSLMAGIFALTLGGGAVITANGRRYLKVKQEERTEQATDALNNLRTALTPRQKVTVTFKASQP